MTSKDYRVLAAAIREAYNANPRAGPRSFKQYDDGVAAVLNNIRRVLAADNPRFDSQRFNEAATPDALT